jgi:anti-anti-sigma factor
MVQDMASEPTDAQLSVDVSVDGTTTVITVNGEVDAASADSVRNRVLEAIEGGAKRLEIDMHDVSFMDSSGLRVLIAGYKAAEAAGGSLGVRNASDVVLRLLEITGQKDRFVSA